MNTLSVLSLGSTRGLWEGRDSEDVRRLSAYGKHLERYVILTHSLKAHRLAAFSLAPNIVCIPTDARGGFQSFVRMLRLGAGMIRIGRITVIQAQDPFFLGLAAVLLGKRFGLPVNVCLYGPNIYDPNWLASHWSHPLLKPLARWVMGQCASIQTDGQMTATALRAAGFPASRIHVKPVVPANMESFLGIEATLRGGGKKVRLLFVGRLVAQKNLDMLLEALALALKRTAVPVCLRIAGSGPEESRLRARVLALGLEGHVEFLGNVPRPLVPELFAAADVFVLSSNYEGYPRVLMEAGAAALPIVSTAVSGSDEAVADGESGFLVPVGDGEAFVQKLLLLIENRQLRERFGMAARRRTQSALNPADNAPRQVAIWKALVENGEPARPREGGPRHLLLFNLATDLDHPILGFTTQWICELARRVDSVDVITMQAGRIEVPPNVRVHSLGKEAGFSEMRRVVNFYRHLFEILRRTRIDGCFSHMTPEFSILAGPILRASGIPLVTWYAHPSLHWRVKVAHWFSHQMVASVFNAYPWRKDKFSVIGQGIDTGLFCPNGTRVQAARILCVGRISPVKDHATLLRAAALLKRPVDIVILGKAASAEDEANLANLRALSAELGIAGRVVFEPGVAPADLPKWYQSCALHVNLTPQGFGDKVAWEAMACGRPCLVANEDFRETLGDYAGDLLFGFKDPQDLARKMSALLEKTPAEQAQIGAYLRGQVERLHCLPNLAARVLELLHRFGRGKKLRACS